MFIYFDRAGEGKLKGRDLVTALRASGCNIDQHTYEEMEAEYEAKPQTLKEFKELRKQHLVEGMPKDKLMEKFKMFDTGDGTMQVQVLANICQSVGDKLTK